MRLGKLHISGGSMRVKRGPFWIPDGLHIWWGNQGVHMFWSYSEHCGRIERDRV